MEQNADTSAPMTPVTENKQKSVNGLKAATAIACVVAVCGIGFGIYGMMQSSQKDSKISEKDNQISDLEAQINNSAKSADNNGSFVENSTGTPFRNPILVSNEDYVLGEIFESDDYYNERRSISISITDGDIAWCKILKPSSDGYGKTTVGDCTITGISGKISAISKMGNTQMTWPYLGFLMEDGTVEYLSAGELADNLSASIKGKLSFEDDKPVVSIISDVFVSPNNSEGVGGYRTTSFYHNDGSISLFNDSMITK